MFRLIVNTQLSNRDTAALKYCSLVFSLCLGVIFFLSVHRIISHSISFPVTIFFFFFWPHVSVNEISLSNVFASKLLIQ